VRPLCAWLVLVSLVAVAPSSGASRAPADVSPTAGRALFRANCGACHTLAAAGTEGTLGPDLDATGGASASEASIAALIARGDPVVGQYASAMPGFEDQLSAAQIGDVAAFVYSSTHPAAAGPKPVTQRVGVTIGRPRATSCIPSRTSVRAGKAVFDVVNRGDASSVFEVDGKKSRRIAPHTTATVAVVFAKGGRYAYSCSIAGMAG
jgi:cytochrome c6